MSWGFPDFANVATLNSRAGERLPNDSLTIVCDISIMGKQMYV
jgi:hypothetical protein